MTLADRLLPEFDQEMATTRTLLEVVPEDKADWAPHPKSTKLGSLALHIAQLAGWGTTILNEPELDVTAPNNAAKQSFVSTSELLEIFDAGVQQARKALAASSDDDMAVDWTFRAGDHVIFTRPRAAVIRSAVLSHIIHHRAQLGVYLRLLDVPVPSVYGPTADSPIAIG